MTGPFRCLGGWTFALLQVFTTFTAASRAPEFLGRGLLQSGPLLPANFTPPPLTCERGGLFPYMVSVRDRKGNHNCGGIVISPNAVLTAAHCVDPRVSTNSNPRPLLYIGGWDRDHPVQTRKTRKAVRPDTWTGDVLDGSDLAILILNETTCAKPVPFIGGDLEHKDKVQFVGFGRTSNEGPFSNVLQAGLFTFVKNKRCAKNFDLRTKPNFKTLCLRSSDVGGVCSGDEGGPSIIRKSVKEFADRLVGIASYNTGDCEDIESVAIFTRVKVYKKWIKRELKKAAEESAKEKKGN